MRTELGIVLTGKILGRDTTRGRGDAEGAGGRQEGIELEAAKARLRCDIKLPYFVPPVLL